MNTGYRNNKFTQLSLSFKKIKSLQTVKSNSKRTINVNLCASSWFG